MNAEQLKKSIVRTSNLLDRSIGMKALYRTSPTASATKSVVVRSMPIGIKEREDITRAGLIEIDAAWFMQTSYHHEVKPGHVLEVPVGGFKYEIKSSTTDELDIEHTIYTRRTK